MAEKPLFGNCEFSAEEQATIQAALKRKLGPSFISQRQGPGGQRLAYIEGWRIVNVANETFGFNGWSHSISRECVDFVDHIEGRFYVGVSAHVKIMLKDGSFHEDVGYGSSEGMRSKALALEKAKKEAVTDGMKRALKSFGNSLGNCLTDRNYLTQIGRAPKPPAETLNVRDLKQDIDEPDIQRARYGDVLPPGAHPRTPGKLNMIHPRTPGKLNINPRTPGKQFTRPDPPTAQRRKSLDGSCQQKLFTANNHQGQKPNGAGDGRHYRSSTHAGLTAAERERLERKQRQLQKQQEFREKLMVKAPPGGPGPGAPPDSEGNSGGKGAATPGRPGGNQALSGGAGRGPLATSTQNPASLGSRDALSPADYDDTSMWDDSQLDHLICENPNKVEAIIEQAQGSTKLNGAPHRGPQGAHGAPQDGSPNTRGRITRSTTKSPFRKVNTPAMKRTPGKSDENAHKRRRMDS